MPEQTAFRRALALLIGAPVTRSPTPRARTGDEELWHISVYVKPGHATEVCNRIAQLDGVAEVYRAWKVSDDA